MSLDTSCEEAYKEVFSDDSSTAWCVLGYDGNKIKMKQKGDGGLDELTAVFDDAQVMFALLRLNKTDDGGDSKRVKFIYITWVGENAPAMKKGRATGDKGVVGKLFQGFHIEKQILERDELEGLGAQLDLGLKKAGGANYDLGNIRSGVQAGAAGSIKSQSKDFFMAKDKETEVQGVVFEKHIRQGKDVMSCDLGGRAMTVGAAQAKENTNGYTNAVVKESS